MALTCCLGNVLENTTGRLEPGEACTPGDLTQPTLLTLIRVTAKRPRQALKHLLSACPSGNTALKAGRASLLSVGHLPRRAHAGDASGSHGALKAGGRKRNPGVERPAKGRRRGTARTHGRPGLSRRQRRAVAVPLGRSCARSPVFWPVCNGRFSAGAALPVPPPPCRPLFPAAEAARFAGRRPRVCTEASPAVPAGGGGRPLGSGPPPPLIAQRRLVTARATRRDASAGWMTLREPPLSAPPPHRLTIALTPVSTLRDPPPSPPSRTPQPRLL